MAEQTSGFEVADHALEKLSELDAKSLARRWRTLVGGRVPAGLGRALMLRVLSYHLQAQRYGDLDRASRQALNDILVRAAERTIRNGSDPRDCAGHNIMRAPQLRPGTVLSREYGGALHRVMVMEQGFSWNGKTYDSLSKVAFAITGTRWKWAPFLRLARSERGSKDGPPEVGRRQVGPEQGLRGSAVTGNSAMSTLRCAIYARVSSDQGLKQDFNSLHAQREAAEAYIKSQAHEGWRLHRDSYDDGGFSGGSMERPALQRLLKDLANGRIDIIVVYKVDRLTRSLSDFAKLIEIFDARKVSFVSVTQSFNTTSSMGRLTLNVLLSFAQFEREVTGERIRDKIAASKKKGLWMGGCVPLGYRVENRKLIVDEAEAETVRLIFQRYLDLGSIRALQRDLLEKGIRTRLRTLASGRLIGGIPLTNGPLNHLLKNRMYVGEINHRGISYPSDHSPVLTPDLFEAVQAQLTAKRNFADLRKAKSGAMLEGRFFNEVGSLMSPSHTVKKGVRYRYYISTPTVQGRASDPGLIRRVSAPEVEALVLRTLRAERPDAADGGGDLEAIDLRVVLQNGNLEVSWINRADTSQSAMEAFDAIEGRCHVLVPFVVVRHKRRRDILIPAQASGYVRPIASDEWRQLVVAIARGKVWLRDVLDGMSTEAIAAREGKSERAIRLTLSLAFLDPKLVKAALQGSLPQGVSARRLFDAPADWHEQWRAIGLSRPV